MSKGKMVCSTHNVTEDMLVEIVLNDIRHHASLTKEERTQVAEALLEKRGQEEREASDRVSRKLREVAKRLDSIGTIFKKLYEDRCTSVIEDDMFREMMENYTVEKAELQKRHEEVFIKFERSKETERDITVWLALVAQHVEIWIND